MQHIKLIDMLKAAKGYYDAGMLTAQHPEPEKRVCLNAGADGSRCAVAAVFNIETLSRYKAGSIATMINDRLVSVDNGPAFILFQMIHDEWANASRNHSNTSDVAFKMKSLFENSLAQVLSYEPEHETTF